MEGDTASSGSRVEKRKLIELLGNCTGDESLSESGFSINAIIDSALNPPISMWETVLGMKSIKHKAEDITIKD